MPQVSSARQVTTSAWGGEGAGGTQWSPPPWPAALTRTPTPSSKAAHTKVAAELLQQLAPRQCGHSQAAIPMATAEQQLSVGGHGQGLPTYTTVWHPRAAQQSLHPDPVRGRRGEARPT